MVEELKDAIANNSKPTTIYYCYDDSGKLAKPAFVADDEQPPVNSTKIPPVKKLSNGMIASLQNPTFDKANQKWIEHPDPVKPSATQQVLMQQAQQITVLQTMVMQQNQSSAKLQATNEQQETQIKQLQQMFMTANQQQAVEKSKEVTAQ